MRCGMRDGVTVGAFCAAETGDSPDWRAFGRREVFMQYKRWMSILRIYRREIRIPFVLVLILMPVLELVSLFRQLDGAEYVYSTSEYPLAGYYSALYGSGEQSQVLWARRLEVLMADAGMDKIFLGALVLLLGALVVMPIRQGRSESFSFAVKRLPVSRFAPFLVEILHAVYCLVILLAVQLGTVFAGAVMYAEMVPAEVQRTQALFLAFMEWDFLRILFPIYDGGMMLCGGIVIIGAAICVTAAGRGIQYGYKNYLSALFLAVMIGRSVIAAGSGDTAAVMYVITAILTVFLAAYQLWVLYDKIVPGKEAAENEEE